jgi:L-lysine 2,3-aminomutase
MFKLSFPQPGMLDPDYLQHIMTAMKRPGASRLEMRAIAEAVRHRMNPHPAGQKEENVPLLDGKPVPGLQHKYRETVLFFPSEVALTCPWRRALVL